MPVDALGARVASALFAGLVGVALCSGADLSAQEPSVDLVILNGRVIDPETGLDAIRNVGIRNGSISAISEFKLTGTKTIDATGQVVSPGFIDLHAHGQEIGDHRMQAVQGVTTVLELESGVLPIGDWHADRAKKRVPLNYGTSAAWRFARIATFSNTGVCRRRSDPA